MKKVSIIIPIYKGEKYIEKNLIIMQNSFLSMFDAVEIIGVVDGKTDDSFNEASKVKGVTIVGYEENRGKGYALKYGYGFATGELIIFIDSDMDIHPKLLKHFFPYLATADMVIGSKRHPFSKLNYPFIRRVLSNLYYLFCRIVLGVSLRDTQTGIKLFKREVLDVILPLVVINGFAFDVELCFLAQKQGFRVVEAPININFQNNGSSICMRSIIKMFFDTLSIRFRYSVLRKYQRLFWQTNFGSGIK